MLYACFVLYNIYIMEKPQKVGGASSDYVAILIHSISKISTFCQHLSWFHSSTSIRTCNECNVVICKSKILQRFIGDCPKGHPGKTLEQRNEREDCQHVEPPRIYLVALCA